MLCSIRVACVSVKTFIFQPSVRLAHISFTRLPAVTFQSLGYSSNRLCRPSGIQRLLSFKKLPFEIDTNVAKDVLLFKYENERFYRLINFFGITQFFFWVYLAQFAHSTLRDASVKEEEKGQLVWWRRINMGDNKYRNGITLLCVSIAYIIIVGTSMFTLRTVKYLVLRKGGNRMAIVTYMPFAKHRTVEVSLDNLTCAHARSQVHAFVPLKVKGYWMHFLLDKRGTYTNTALFDQTAGIQRKWKR